MDGNGLFSANEFLWKRNRALEVENRQLHQQVQTLKQQVEHLRQRQRQVQQLQRENALLKQQVAELTRQASAPAPPAFIKANTPRRRHQRPGRRLGHAPALRPRPASIDVHQPVPLPQDDSGHAACPTCGTQLQQLQEHQRLVEEIVPARKLTICYHTASGYCPCCRKRVESRAAEQPPAANLPHGQLGLNALALAALLRVFYRLPLRQISQLLAHLTEVTVSPGGIAKQIQRLGRWLKEDQEQIRRALQLSAVVNADETAWRNNGHNDYLWTLTNERYTLYHVDRSRGGKVIRRLLGKGFGRQGQTLISDFYSVYDQFPARQQKCLAHLLRELHQTTQRRPELKRQGFFRGCKAVLKAMLKLKAQQEHAPPEQYSSQVKRLEERLARLGQKTWNDADADRLAARVRKYQERLTTFLHDPAVEPTNNEGERAIRPAVVMRKITGGSRSPKGAKAWATLASVIRTAYQQHRDLLETLKTLIRAHWSGQSLPLLTSQA